MAGKKKAVTGSSAANRASPLQMKPRQRQGGKDLPVASAVSVRRMTPEEERQLEAVFDLFLKELVHEQFERQ